MSEVLSDWMTNKDHSLYDKNWFYTDEDGNRVQKFEYSGVRESIQRGAYRNWEKRINGNAREETNVDWWDTGTARDGRTDLIDPKEAVPWARFLWGGEEPWAWERRNAWKENLQLQAKCQTLLPTEQGQYQDHREDRAR